MRQSHHGNLENWNLINFTALKNSKNLTEGNEVYKGGVILLQFFKPESLRGEIMNVGGEFVSEMIYTRFAVAVVSYIGGVKNVNPKRSIMAQRV